MSYMKRSFIGLIRDHKTRVGRIKALKRAVDKHGGEGKVKGGKKQ